jgi:hypothetical protein
MVAVTQLSGTDFPIFSGRKIHMEDRVVVDLAGLLAKYYIARTDVKAVQRTNGEYNPVREAWKRSDIEAHLSGQRTYGHYLLDAEDRCKFFAFDIDLDKPELHRRLDPMPVPLYPFPYKVDTEGMRDEDLYKEIRSFHPREAWMDRAHPARGWMKFQLRIIADTLAWKIRTELDIPVAVTYTGAKGLHVYGLTGLMPAKDVREGAQIVIDSLDDTSLGAMSSVGGEIFYRFDNQDPIDGQPNITIEVFPKQDSLEGKDLGNLVRLPLGRNLKNPKDPTFFVDMTSPLSDIKSLDPEFALTEALTQPWRRKGE